MRVLHFRILLMLTLLLGCNQAAEKKEALKTDENGFVQLTDEQVENIVKRSYQYIALYNVNNKFALKQGGYNSIQADTKLKDHTTKEIARPNNDSFYTTAMLDLRAEPIILFLPVFGSKYTSLMVTAYDHYVDVPKTTGHGDFAKPEKILFYSDRTAGYNGEPVEGVDLIYKTTGDFVSAVLRIMPHANEPEKFNRIVDIIQTTKIETLSEFKGESPKAAEPIAFPEVGKTDLDVFQNNFLEVMQFVFNHISFDSKDKMDQEVLSAMALVGVEPGKAFHADEYKIDGERFKAEAAKVQKEYLSKLSDPSVAKKLAPHMFKPKGQTDLETVLTVSIIGPIGLPMEEAMYPNVTADNGEQLNAMNDYVIRMTKDQLPPDQAFWSLTLYDKANGFFIPNDRKKYSVGLNGGYELNEAGGIEIYVAAEKPDGVPEANWLPLNRKDEDIDLILRVYVPDLEKMKTWQTPKAQKL